METQTSFLLEIGLEIYLSSTNTSSWSSLLQGLVLTTMKMIFRVMLPIIPGSCDTGLHKLALHEVAMWRIKLESDPPAKLKL
ncbi:hypothetical protein CCR75_008102 [Bremia lactucae]|uniref:Uncharacterized protein n=1 Tax=Bremia lactucae TaxID=4779 RepID=A0A976IEK8_BRELC|nr:hypothetical protein CCR75_008102 [Bremia lactucae]